MTNIKTNINYLDKSFIAFKETTLLTVLIPTYNEQKNIEKLIFYLLDILKHISLEIIVIDDNSPDGTWKTVQNLQKNIPNLFCIRRIQRKGLSSAVIEGALLARSEYVAVIDADFQHDISILPQFLETAQSGYDVVIGSRYCDGGSTGK